MWILQEIANARVAVVQCGKKFVSARTFAQVPSLISFQPSPQCQAVLDIMPGISRKESWWSRKRDLQTLLRKFRGSEATDPRDMIYALLAISSDACDLKTLRPDYSEPIERVTRNTISFLLSQTDLEASLDNLPDMTLPEFFKNLDSISNALIGSASEKGDIQTVKIFLQGGGSDIDSKRNRYLDKSGDWERSGSYRSATT
jgi:hypothetical protein